jgi:hypothetical protein
VLVFEMAADYAKFNTDFEILGGYLSPVSGKAYPHTVLLFSPYKSQEPEVDKRERGPGVHDCF